MEHFLNFRTNIVTLRVIKRLKAIKNYFEQSKRKLGYVLRARPAGPSMSATIHTHTLGRSSATRRSALGGKARVHPCLSTRSDTLHIFSRTRLLAMNAANATTAAAAAAAAAATQPFPLSRHVNALTRPASYGSDCDLRAIHECYVDAASGSSASVNCTFTHAFDSRIKIILDRRSRDRPFSSACQNRSIRKVKTEQVVGIKTTLFSQLSFLPDKIHDGGKSQFATIRYRARHWHPIVDVPVTSSSGPGSVRLRASCVNERIDER